MNYNEDIIFIRLQKNKVFIKKLLLHLTQNKLSIATPPGADLSRDKRNTRKTGL